MSRGWTLALALSFVAIGALQRHDAALAGDEAKPGDPKALEDAKAAEKAKWGEHMGDLPFVVGYEKGMKEVEFTGRPPMYFFTATW